MTTTSLIASLLIAFGTIAINAIINITVKYAPDEKTALRLLRKRGWTILRLIFALANVALFIWNALSPNPISRVDAAVMVLQGSVFAMALMGSLLHGMLDLIKRIVASQQKLAESQNTTTDQVGRLLGVVETISQHQLERDPSLERKSTPPSTEA